MAPARPVGDKAQSHIRTSLAGASTCLTSQLGYMFRSATGMGRLDKNGR
jgi:hypothetical protein